MDFDIELADFPVGCIKCYHCVAACKTGALQKNGTIPEDRFLIDIHPEEMELLISQRRTHRDFSNRKVAPETLLEFISRLRYSPTASNCQNLSFTVITSSQMIGKLNNMTIEELRHRFSKLNRFTLPIAAMKYGKGLNKLLAAKEKFMLKSCQNQNMITYNAPAVIIVHAPDETASMPQLNAGIWTGMALLYAELLDLGTCVNGYVVTAMKSNAAMKKTFQIPEEHQVLSCLLIGYPKDKYYRKAERNEPSINWI
jgi:nitroreductase